MRARAAEHVGKRELQKERQLGMDVGIQRPKDDDVAHDELRHDTTSSLRTDEQEGKVRSGRPSNRVSASPGERATKPTREVRARGAEQPAENSTESARKPNGELHQEPRQSRRAVPETPKATGENARAGKMTGHTKACTKPEQGHQREHNGQEVDKPAMGAD